MAAAPWVLMPRSNAANADLMQHRKPVDGADGFKTPQQQLQDQNEVGDLIRVSISLGCIITSLVLLAFCDIVRALINTAVDTRKLLDATLAANAKKP